MASESERDPAPGLSRTNLQVPVPRAQKKRRTIEPKLVCLFPVLGEFDLVWNEVDCLRIGRAAEMGSRLEGRTAHIEVGDTFVSREHLVIQRKDATWQIRDLSSNGASVDGEDLPKKTPIPIEEGALIRLGQTLLWFGAKTEGRTEISAPGFYKYLGPRPFCPSFNAEFVQFIEQLDDLPTKLNIFLTGDTGSGKSELAKSIHEMQGRTGAFVKLNCANVNANLFEATVFGARKGAYTDAKQDVVGLVEQAHGGTLFLDEVVEIPLVMQAKLLTFLDNGEYRPLGDKQSRQAQCLVISASNRAISEQVRLGNFREDLYFRLSAYTFQLSPLRRRHADLVHFVQSWVTPADLLDVHLLEKWLLFPWPGNLRELHQCALKLSHSGEDPLPDLDVMAHGAAGRDGIPDPSPEPGVGATAPPSTFVRSEDLPDRLRNMTRAELAVEFLKADLQFDKLAERLGIGSAECSVLLEFHRLTRTDLSINSMRTSNLRHEILEVVGSKKAVADLFKLKYVYGWYR